MLRYLLNVETRGSQSLLNIDAFADPTAYALVVKKPGSDEQVTQHIDLIETFNYLLGLRLENMAAPQTFTASFTRQPDPELPEDQHTKLVVDGKIQPTADGKWWFRKLEGWVPADPRSPNNGQKERVLIVWRKLTGNLEEDNRMLDEWFTKTRISTRDFEYDTIYVNGSNNLPNLKKDDEKWKVRLIKVRLIEEEFHKKMWEVGEYKTDDGQARVDVRLVNESLWMTQSDMALLFQCSADNISLHLKNIYDEGELSREATAEEFSVVRNEGNREVKRRLDYYNLDIIFSAISPFPSKPLKKLRVTRHLDTGLK